MSEAATPQTPEEKPASEAVNTTPTPPVKPARNGAATGLAAFALLIGLAGAGAGGWSLWQLQQMQSRDQQQTEALQRTRDDSAKQLQGLARQLDARLAELPSASELNERRRLLANLQSDQQRLSQRLESVLDGSRQDWRLDEAEHLLRLASLRLSALQDVASAEALVLTADDILREQDDPAAFAAREQLSRSLEALRTTQRPDRVGLFLQLGALREQAATLNPLAPTFEGQGDVLSDLAAEGDGSAWWGEWVKKLSEYFRIEFDADRNVRPLLSGQSLSQVRLSLSLALEQAQWAALHGQTGVYRQALKQAEEILDAHFNLDNPDSRALRQRFAELADATVEVKVPDLSDSLDALQAYLHRKQAQRRQGAAAAEEAQ
ncbi:uroporphyrinogen-III C-methyltransferase [Pseudomonas sp. GD04158]|uniref:uroporphyrinogen-III C-methyltransferase n=1 Tax=Pseudomonadaceae TaxID=135621 RepID=UPI0020B70B0E|nr:MULTISPECIES: uroporphyrinogen-III C-methyltransferase [unclassified Pseudomonas]MDH0096157.1 uroporphyrinogen-III C-methyltransferase [Pseudomonas sp. GD04158]UTH36783.1 uroporphyrinogen-III C-methyltransferase [Pseudomonas sp. KHPS1]